MLRPPSSFFTHTQRQVLAALALNTIGPNYVWNTSELWLALARCLNTFILTHTGLNWALRGRGHRHTSGPRGGSWDTCSPVRFGSVLRALLDSGLAQSELATPSLALTLAGFAVFSDRPSCLCLAASSNNTLIQQEKDAKTPEWHTEKRRKWHTQRPT